MKSVELSREEALNILKALSKVEGYLYQVKDSSQILAVVDEQVKLIFEKLATDEN